MFETVTNPGRPNWVLRGVAVGIAIALVIGLAWILRMNAMPLRSYDGPLAPLSSKQTDLRNRLAEHVAYLSQTIGERNLERPGSLRAAAEYLRSNLQQAGYTVTEQTYSVGNQKVSNLEANLAGSEKAGGTVIVGAHYDSVAGAPGADDNGTGVAAVLELARLLQGSKLRKTIRFVLFVNEEPPYFQTNEMGSRVYARQLRSEGIPISAMISLETIGFYSDGPGSQKYPPVLSMLYPNRGNFIGFVGNSESRDLVRRVVRRFRESAKFPSEGIAAPDNWPGMGWSDHWSFWQEQFPAIMVTDTAPFRYPYYHTQQDTADHLDVDKMARVVDGVKEVIVSLASDSH